MTSNKDKILADFSKLPDEAFIRLKYLMEVQVLPYSATTLWRKCRSGEFPSPIKVSTGITAWRVGDIRAYLHKIASGGAK